MSFRILSTKLLTATQQQLLLNANIAFVHANFIETKPLEFTSDAIIENAIFTSKNALKAIQNKPVQIKNVFCVGIKTKAFAEANNLNVIEQANNAEELADIIVKNYTESAFTFFCGTKRHPSLPNKLKENGILLKEIIVYTTKLAPKKFSGDYDGILFFSPSAIESFVQLNTLDNSTAFCIGQTTAKEAIKHTEKIITATKPSVENVLVQVIKYAKEQIN